VIVIARHMVRIEGASTYSMCPEAKERTGLEVDFLRTRFPECLLRPPLEVSLMNEVTACTCLSSRVRKEPGIPKVSTADNPVTRTRLLGYNCAANKIRSRKFECDTGPCLAACRASTDSSLRSFTPLH
jgi:hypothetical protein